MTSGALSGSSVQSLAVFYGILSVFWRSRMVLGTTREISFSVSQNQFSHLLFARLLYSPRLLVVVMATFNAALVRCGIIQPAAQLSFIDQGYPSMIAFSRLTEEEVERFVKTVNKLPAVVAGAEPAAVPHIPFGSIKNLKAMRRYAIDCRRLGLRLVHNRFDLATMNGLNARMDFEAQLKVNEVKPPPLPEKFVSFTKWRTFSEGFTGHCSVLRGCMNIPLSYLLREHDTPDDEMRAATYANSDARYSALVLFSGEEYAHDNIRLYDILRPLTYNTAAWDYVKHLDKSKNGRKAFQTLSRRGEGDAARSARRSAAEDVILKAQYTGKSKRFTLQSYINLLQGAFTDLSECGEPYSEEKKVEVFVRGLVSDRMHNYRTAIIQNDRTRLDFQEAYAFVETMEGFNAVVSKSDGFDRNISSVDAGKKKDDGTYRSKEEWSKLSFADRKRIQSLRDKSKANKKRKAEKKEPTRKLAELAAEMIKDFKESKESEDSTGGASQGGDSKKGNNDPKPSNQFGRQAHAVMKFAEGIVKLGETKDS